MKTGRKRGMALVMSAVLLVSQQFSVWGQELDGKENAGQTTEMVQEVTEGVSTEGDVPETTKAMETVESVQQETEESETVSMKETAVSEKEEGEMEGPGTEVVSEIPDSEEETVSETVDSEKETVSETFDSEEETVSETPDLEEETDSEKTESEETELSETQETEETEAQTILIAEDAKDYVVKDPEQEVYFSVNIQTESEQEKVVYQWQWTDTTREDGSSILEEKDYIWKEIEGENLTKNTEKYSFKLPKDQKDIEEMLQKKYRCLITFGETKLYSKAVAVIWPEDLRPSAEEETEGITESETETESQSVAGFETETEINSETETEIEEKIITGFADYDIKGDMPMWIIGAEPGTPVEELDLPKTVPAFLKDVKEPVEIPVTWVPGKESGDKDPKGEAIAKAEKLQAETLQGEEGLQIGEFTEKTEDIQKVEFIQEGEASEETDDLKSQEVPGIDLDAVFADEYSLGEEVLEQLFGEKPGRLPWIRVEYALAEVDMPIADANLPTEEKSGLVWYTTAVNAFNIRGVVNGSPSIKTTYNEQGYTFVFNVDGNQNNKVTFGGNGVTKNVNGMNVTQTLTLVNDGAYIKISYDVYNPSTAAHTVSLGFWTDVQINTDDRAPIYPTGTGARMASSATNEQFNLICKNAYGVTNTDVLWYGQYSQAKNNIFGSSTNSTLTGIDSGIAISWKNRLIQPGETKTYSCLLGIGKSADPPQLSGDIGVKVNPATVDVTASVKDSSNMMDRLYYVMDMGTEDESQPKVLDTKKGTGAFQNMGGSIPRPSTWQAGEIHSVSVWVMNDASAMSSIKTVYILVEESKEDGDDVMLDAVPTKLSFAANGGSGTGPAVMSVFEQQVVELPTNSFTPPSGKQFAGWEMDGGIYPAATKFTVPKNAPSEGWKFNAYWIDAGMQTYYLDFYEQTMDGLSYKKVETRILSGMLNTSVSFPESELRDRSGFILNRSKGSFSGKIGPAANPLHLSAYYDRERNTVTFITKEEAGPEDKVVSVIHGSTVSASNIPKPVSSDKNLTFGGWFLRPNGGGAEFSAERKIKEDTRVYAYWINSADVTFAYNYMEYGIPRVGSLQHRKHVTTLECAAGDANATYRVKEGTFPENPRRWYTVDGDEYEFDGWYLGDMAVDKDQAYTLDQTKDMVIKARWKQVYDIFCIKTGSGAVTGHGTYDKNVGKVEVTWKPDKGYITNSVLLDGNQLSPAEMEAGKIEFDPLMGHHTINVTFTKAQEQEPDVPPSTEPDESDDVYYTVSAKQYGRVDMTPAASVKAGEDHAVMWKAADGWTIYRVEIDGIEQNAETIKAGAYKFEKVQSDHKVAVYAKETETSGEPGDSSMEYFTISTCSFGVRETGLKPSFSVKKGENAEVTWISNSDIYEIQRIEIDGTELSGEEIAKSIYTFADVRRDHTVELYAVLKEGKTEPPADPDKLKQYSIITEKYGNDKLLVTPGKTVEQGEDYSVQWKWDDPAPVSWTIYRVEIDSTVLTEDEIAAGTYTFHNIQSDHKVEVYAGKDSEVPPPGEPGNKEKYYTISTRSYGDQKADITSSASVKENGSLRVTWSAPEGCGIYRVEIDGVIQNDAVVNSGYFDFVNIQSDHMVEVYTEDIETPSAGDKRYFSVVTKKFGKNISLTPSASVEAGGTWRVQWSAPENVNIYRVIIDGAEQNSTYIKRGFYDFRNIKVDHKVEVYSKSVQKPGEPDTPDPNYFTVYTQSYGTRSTNLTPTFSLLEGEDGTVAWSTDTCKINRMEIDGITQDAAVIGRGTYTFTDIRRDHTVEIYAEDLPITVEPDDPTDVPMVYTISTQKYGTEEISLTPSGSVVKGGSYSVKWSAPREWKIYCVEIDGVSLAQVGSRGSYTFEDIKADHKVEVFARKSTDTEDPDPPPKYYSITNRNYGTKVTLSPSVTVEEGKTSRVTWTKESEYTILRIQIDGVIQNQEVVDRGWFDFENVHEDHRVDVFAEDMIDETIPVNPNPESIYHRVTTRKHGGQAAWISPSVVVKEGDSYRVEWHSRPGCRIHHVTIDGVIQTDDVLSRGYQIFRDIKQDHTVEIYSSETGFYTIETSIKNGTITPSASVQADETYEVIWEAKKGYRVTRIVIDNVERVPTQVERLKGSYCFKDIANGHEIQVFCEKEDPSDPDDMRDFNVKTVIYGGPGTITPSVDVKEGDDLLINWNIIGKDEKEKKHYKVSKIFVDGKELNDKEAENIQFQDIAEDHEVEVYLEPNLINVKVTSIGQGTVSSSETMFCGDNYNAYAKAAPGWKLSAVYRRGKDGKLIQIFPVHQEDKMSKARSMSADMTMPTYNSEETADSTVDYADSYVDIEEDMELQFVFIPEDGNLHLLEDYHYITTMITGGIGTISPNAVLSPGEQTTITWNPGEGYFVAFVSIMNDETHEERILQDIDEDMHELLLNDVQSNMTVTVHLAPERKNYNGEMRVLNTDIHYGTGTITPSCEVPKGNEIQVEWQAGEGSFVAKVEVDGEDRPDLLDKNSCTLTMDEDHSVIVYMNGVGEPYVTKSAVNTAGHPDGKVYVGDVLEYTVHVGNNSATYPWTNALFEDQIPEGLTLNPSSIHVVRTSDGTGVECSQSYDESSRILGISLGTIGAAEDYSIIFNATVNELTIRDDSTEAWDIGNMAAVSGTDMGNHLIDDIRPSDKVYPREDDQTIPVDVTAYDPQPLLRKTAQNHDRDDAVSQVGDVVTYIIEIGNGREGSVWKDVITTDYVPAGLKIYQDTIRLESPDGTVSTDAVSYNPENRSVQTRISSIYSGAIWRLLFDVEILPEAVEGAQAGAIVDIGNIAVAVGRKQDGTPDDSEQKTDPVYPNENDKPENGGVRYADPAPSVHKAAKNQNRDNKRTQPGDVITYTITVSNQAANSIWKHAVVRDRIPEGLEVKSDTIRLIKPDGTAMSLGSNVYRRSSRLMSVFIGDVKGGETFALEFDTVVKEEAKTKHLDIGNMAWANGGSPKEDLIPGMSGGYQNEGHVPGEAYFPADDGWLGTGDAIETGVTYPSEEDIPGNEPPAETETESKTESESETESETGTKAETETEKEKRSEAVKTGDETNLIFPILLMTVSALVLLICIAEAKKRKVN